MKDAKFDTKHNTQFFHLNFNHFFLLNAIPHIWTFKPASNTPPACREYLSEKLLQQKKLFTLNHWSIVSCHRAKISLTKLKLFFYSSDKKKTFSRMVGFLVVSTFKSKILPTEVIKLILAVFWYLFWKFLKNVFAIFKAPKTTLCFRKSFSKLTKLFNGKLFVITQTIFFFKQKLEEIWDLFLWKQNVRAPIKFSLLYPGVHFSCHIVWCFYKFVIYCCQI